MFYDDAYVHSRLGMIQTFHTTHNDGDQQRSEGLENVPHKTEEYLFVLSQDDTHRNLTQRRETHHMFVDTWRENMQSRETTGIKLRKYYYFENSTLVSDFCNFRFACGKQARSRDLQESDLWHYLSGTLDEPSE